MSEYKAFKKLIKKYRSITRAHIGKMVDDDFSWDIIKKELTGFGNTETCTLCQDAGYVAALIYTDCIGCDWIKLTGGKCNDPSNKNHITYKKIGQANTIEDLYQAYQDRANYMEKVLNKDKYRRFSSVENVLKAILDGRKFYIKREINQ